jgi:hypothetical protein
MTASGQSRRFDLLSIKSALPRTSDVSGRGRHFAFVPIADLAKDTLAGELGMIKSLPELGHEVSDGQRSPTASFDLCGRRQREADSRQQDQKAESQYLCMASWLRLRKK